MICVVSVLGFSLTGGASTGSDSLDDFIDSTGLALGLDGTFTVVLLDTDLFAFKSADDLLESFYFLANDLLRDRD